MEEADALSDRIALMSHGEVRCCGSPLYLKERFGSGYSLTLTKDQQVFSAERMQTLAETVLGQQLSVQSDVAREICFSVPNALSGRLPDLLTSVESEKARLGILNYGISSSTVEDVYIKYMHIHIHIRTNRSRYMLETNSFFFTFL